MTQQAKAARGVVEPGGDVLTGDFIDVEGAQRLVLAVQGVDGAQEGVNEGIVCISQWRLFINISPLSQYYGTSISKRNKYMQIRINIANFPEAIRINKVKVCLSINGEANRRGEGVLLDCGQMQGIRWFFWLSVGVVLTYDLTWSSRLVSGSQVK
jgi:hypothetical protein